MADADLAAELAAFTDDLTEGRALPGSDLVFLGAEEPADLGRLAELRTCLQPRGGIWVVFRKGRGAARPQSPQRRLRRGEST